MIWEPQRDAAVRAQLNSTYFFEYLITQSIKYLPVGNTAP